MFENGLIVRGFDVVDKSNLLKGGGAYGNSQDNDEHL